MAGEIIQIALILFNNAALHVVSPDAVDESPARCEEPQYTRDQCTHP